MSHMHNTQTFIHMLTHTYTHGSVHVLHLCFILLSIVPTVEFQETSYDATEPLSNFDIDRIVATLNLTRKGDLSYTTAVRYEIMADRASFQPPRDPGQEVVFHPQETVKEIKIELRANHQSDENENVYVNLVEGRVLDNVSVPAAVGQLKLSVIRVRNQEYRGPFFPDLPAVANNGEPISAIAVGKLYYDLPLLCITVSLKLFKQT